MNKEELRKYIESNMSYLALYDMEGNLIDAFLNMKMVNDYYIEQHQRILQSKADNVTMTFRAIADGCIVGATYPNMIDKVNMVVYSPDEFLENHPEFFLTDD